MTWQAWRSAVLEKNLDRAYLYLKSYLRLYPKSSRAYEGMGDYYKAKGDTTQAARHYMQAKALTD
jgi:tetratricopeptide (TPR) repeat protein